MPAPWSTTDARYPRWPIHLALLAVSFVMLVPFYWVLKTSRLRREHLRLSARASSRSNPHPFYYVDVWYCDPLRPLFPEQRHRLGA